MPSIFERLYRVGPASLLFKAIIVAIVLDALLLAFILLRRTLPETVFKKRDAPRLRTSPCVGTRSFPERSRSNVAQGNRSTGESWKRSRWMRLKRPGRKNRHGC